MEYYSAIRRNGFEAVLVVWINLEPVHIESEEKNKYCILMQIHGIYGTDEPICREGMETDVEKKLVDTVREAESGKN